MRTETSEPWPCGFCGGLGVGEEVIAHARHRHHPDAYPRWEMDDETVRNIADARDFAAMRFFGWDPETATAAEWRRLVMLIKPTREEMRWNP